MSKTVERLKAELSRLQVSERSEIAHFLIHSLDDTAYDADAEAAWDATLTRRYDEIKNSAAIGEAAEEVLAWLRQKH
jgi:Putative addiction module component